ncbi:MAG TPA: hypothetical protein PLV92_23190 [Pirellulaceae bacterium]|nr:hypothetical protein [Pirellulaceae bacterium]
MSGKQEPGDGGQPKVVLDDQASDASQVRILASRPVGAAGDASSAATQAGGSTPAQQKPAQSASPAVDPRKETLPWPLPPELVERLKQLESTRDTLPWNGK